MHRGLASLQRRGARDAATPDAVVPVHPPGLTRPVHMNDYRHRNDYMNEYRHMNDYRQSHMTLGSRPPPR
jgi:hypothetical protein